MFDEIEIDIPCPNCDNKLKTTVKKLRTNPVLHCKHCGDDIKINADTSKFDRETQKVEKSLKKLKQKNLASKTLLKECFTFIANHSANSCI